MANNKDYRKISGWEVHPLDIVEKLIVLADLYVDGEELEIARQHLTDALYHLDAVCQNDLNSDYFRTFYNVLSNIAEKTEV